MFLSSRQFLITLSMMFFSGCFCFAGPKFRIISSVVHGPVANAKLCINTPDTCIASDDSGYVAVEFSVPDSAAFKFSAPGYEDTIVTRVNGDTMLIAMKPFEVNDRSMEIVVVAPSVKRNEDSYRQSSVSITQSDLKTKAGGVQDIGRYIGTLPSAVSSLSKNYDNTFFVRGGRPSENIFLIDGIELENIDHFSQANGSGGPLGFVNADNVRDVQFYAGNMPVNYPSKMSSVVDIRMRNGSVQEARQTAGFELTGGLLAAEGPIRNGKSSYIFSGRYVDLTPLHKYFDQKGTVGIPKLGDIYGKVMATDGKIDLSATGILSYNKYDYSLPFAGFTDNLVFFWDSLYQKERIFQGGVGIAAHYAGETMAHEVHASFSFRDGVNADSLASFTDTFFTHRYASNPVSTDDDYRARYLVSTKSDLSLNEYDTLSIGLRASKNDYHFSRSDVSQFQGECVVCNSDGTTDTVTVSKSPMASSVSIDNAEYGFSADVKYEWGMLRGMVGVRGDYFRLLDDFAASPRLSFSLRPGMAGVFTGSVGLYHQFPTELPFQVFDFYYWVFPNTSRDSLQHAEKTLLRQAQPERCWQTSVGYDKFLWHSIETRLEAYYKWYYHDYHFLGPGSQEVFYWNTEGHLALQKQNGNRRVYGMELSIGNQDYKSFFYSLSASLFDVKNRYTDGKWYDDWTAVRYTYSVALGACFFRDHTLSFSVQGSGGRPYCPLLIALDCIDRPYLIYDPGVSYYAARMDNLIATNMKYSFTKRIGRFGIGSFIEVLNLLDYKPALEYQFNGVGFTEIKPFGFTPVIGCTVQW
jgi:hypothetical protein